MYPVLTPTLLFQILYMAQAEKIGIIGEIIQAAKTLGLEKDIPVNLKMTRPEVILQIVQTPVACPIP